MIEYFLLLLICSILIYSNFVHLHPKTETMIAYVGEDHPRLFERVYIRSSADLFVFRNKAYNSINMKYEKKGTELDFFEYSDYKNMLVISLSANNCLTTYHFLYGFGLMYSNARDYRNAMC